MIQVLKPEDILKTVINPDKLKVGMVVALTSNVLDSKVYCFVASVSKDKIMFFNYRDDHIERCVFTADDLIEYDVRIEILK